VARSSSARARSPTTVFRLQFGLALISPDCRAGFDRLHHPRVLSGKNWLLGRPGHVGDFSGLTESCRSSIGMAAAVSVSGRSTRAALQEWIRPPHRRRECRRPDRYPCHHRISSGRFALRPRARTMRADSDRRAARRDRGPRHDRAGVGEITMWRVFGCPRGAKEVPEWAKQMSSEAVLDILQGSMLFTTNASIAIIVVTSSA
jgi:hypothetical protein